MYIFHIVLHKKFFFYCIDIYFVCYIKTSMVYYGVSFVCNCQLLPISYKGMVVAIFYVIPFLCIAA